MTAEELQTLLDKVEKTDKTAALEARRRWDQVAKPLHSLGLLEDVIVQIASIASTARIDIGKKALIIMCADNGIVEEGVTQTGREVTAVVTENFTKGDSCVCIIAEKAGVDVFPVDIGVAGPLEHTGDKYPLLSRRIRNGTQNFLKGPAMSRQEVLSAVSAGIELVRDLKSQGYKIAATGEMGIGNTTTSSAVASVLTGAEPELMTGKGAGLTDQGLKRKISVIKEGIALHRPDPDDGLDVLSKVGGLDLAGLTGVFLGGAIYRMPVLIDGFISAAAALAAKTMCPLSAGYMIASHFSSEPAVRILMERLGKKPVLSAGMCLGEGTGAIAVLPLFDMAAAIYEQMSTFKQIRIEEYKPLA